ncbi:rhodanese-like domain-containing protein [Antrihabitans cavernicola]|uniref:Rhodanese-like domain-containing protein n=1 Tax=Antrihabitans cavernicola TaxID=2495913 RepID=A0A5A7S4B9_9NOCA|nr:rhodanese-like domain-containing protein [Spelaeibacter cavernicola]KAA0017080.1 rhodanese-like domain-containing protein [Spelaeibacter cavernicola]
MTYAGDISPQAAWDLLRDDPKAVLVDVRTQGEWNAIGIPDIAELDRPAHYIEWVDSTGTRNTKFVDDLREAGVSGGPVVFLCRSGQRSVHAANAATAAGIEPSYNVLEGFEGPVGPSGQRDVSGWKVLGLPWQQS